MSGVRLESRGNAGVCRMMKKETMGLDISRCKGEGQFRTGCFRWLLEREVDVRSRKVVDLGAGPCVFARIAEEFGADVTAVDARDDRVPEDIGAAQHRRGKWWPPLRRAMDGDREEGGKSGSTIRFIHGDVRSVDLDAYDVVMVFGLLYHFGIEEQIDLLQRCRGKVVLIDTMVCCPDMVTEYPRYGWQCEVDMRDGYEGWVYPENSNVMASVGNATSFWHTEESYGRLFADCGFDDMTAYRPMYLAKYGMRSFYRLGKSRED